MSIYAAAETRTFTVLLCSLCDYGLLEDDETCSGCGAQIVALRPWRPA